MSSPHSEPLRSRAGPGRPAHGSVQDPGRRASPRGDERDAVVPTSPPTSFTGAFSRNVRTPAESRTGPRPHHRRDGRRLSPRRHEVHDRRLAGRLGDSGRDGPPGPRHGPAPPGHVPRRSLVLPRSGPLRCRESVLKRSRGHAPGRDRRGSLRRATRRATTPHAGEPERLLSSRARRRPGTRGRKGRLSPQGRDRVVLHVVVEPGYRALSETLSRRPEPTTSSGPSRQTTTPPARKESTVRSLQGSQGEPVREVRPGVDRRWVNPEEAVSMAGCHWCDSAGAPK
jgi:hypothetical protein